MEKSTSYFIIYLFYLLTITLFGTSCNRNKELSYQLDKAESLIQIYPDSSLFILESIPKNELRNRKEIARYSLLMSMALDKNYIDTTSLDIIHPAIEYYSKNGTPDEKLQTFYYRGRIFQNQDNHEAAMLSFMEAVDLKDEISDSLLLAHTLVAQGALYLEQYKINNFIQNNLEAAKLYDAVGKDLLEIKSYAKAIDGQIMLNNQAVADSLISKIISLIQTCPDGEPYLFSSMLSYVIEFGNYEDIKTFLNEYQDIELSKDEKLNFVQAYYKIGNYDKAISTLSNIKLSNSLIDSLKYTLLKTDILEKQGEYKSALDSYKEYNSMLERYQNNLISQDLLFSDKKHSLELENIKNIQNRDKIIWWSLSGLFFLLILVGWLYYIAFRNKTKHILAEKENENLEKEKKLLLAEKRQKELETDNLKLEISQLEAERENLIELQKEYQELGQPIKDIIKQRLDILNGLLAKEISNKESYAEPYKKLIDSIHKDKKHFLDSSRLAFAAENPKLMKYLEEKGLSDDEISSLSLYAIGLKGKEVGEYLQQKRHYIISHEIREKLGIDEHETNIGLYIRRLMINFGK